MLQHRIAEVNALKEKQSQDMKILTEDLRMQCEMKLREQEKILKCHFSLEVHGFKVQEEKNL